MAIRVIEKVRKILLYKFNYNLNIVQVYVERLYSHINTVITIVRTDVRYTNICVNNGLSTCVACIREHIYRERKLNT